MTPMHLKWPIPVGLRLFFIGIVHMSGGYLAPSNFIISSYR